MIRTFLTIGFAAVALAACSSEPEEPKAPAELSSAEKVQIYEQMLKVRDNVYLQQVAEITGRPVTDPESITRSAFVICGHIAQANGPEEWLEFSTAFADNIGVGLEQAGSLFGATIQSYCPVLEDHYFNTVVKSR